MNFCQLFSSTFPRNLIRKTRTSQLKSVDNTQDSNIFLGRSDRDFEFSQLSQKISFAECSAKNNDIDQLKSFINSL
jgi:signal recognition particle receptor subunit beta